ncbi:uncharacterized protein B0H64DRAFT_349857 [Chaetomium fimeti]|uniref:2EXR domain-containing protein n=1 Tax=Chaetomium fimeti TaxID=1854472 RepID=A0AAE0H6V3_9PEZI|nr:hypothetical protein B0H64DRAFT_349857 [Chaetomium fimeti]
MENNTTTPGPLLFNDVYSSRWEALSPALGTAFFPFRRLPVELRLHVWLLSLQRYRMIEVDISSRTDDGVANSLESRCYIDPNHLGRVISGGGYTLALRGHESKTTPLILQVNREARGAALSFYQIHLPFPKWQYREQVLYLNPKYDVVFVRPRRPKTPPGWNSMNPRPEPKFANLLVDLLHDARAYDYKDQGVAHLALDRDYFSFLVDRFTGEVHLTPASLHPVAAASFTEILRNKLHSLLQVIHFRNSKRGLGEFPAPGWNFHFAQTFPLCRRGNPIGSFHWLPADPRPGIEIDLRQVPLGVDPRDSWRGWCQLEHAFGIAQRATGGKDGNKSRFYICPTQFWPDTADTQEQQEEVWSRGELVQFLDREAESWLQERQFFAGIYGSTPPKYGYESETEMLEAMEKLPCTAIGMWLFPPEAFKEPTNPQRVCFDVRTTRPGLFLFEV